VAQSEFATLPFMRDEDDPPFLGTWRRVYVATMIYLAALIFAFYVFTRIYR
jgi:hypothetical protein